MRSLKYVINKGSTWNKLQIHRQSCVIVPPLGPEAKQPPLTSVLGGRKRGQVCEVTEGLLRVHVRVQNDQWKTCSSKMGLRETTETT